jgi:hypothetical protein
VINAKYSAGSNTSGGRALLGRHWSGRAPVWRIRSAAGGVRAAAERSAPPNWPGGAGVWRFVAPQGAPRGGRPLLGRQNWSGCAGVWRIRRAAGGLRAAAARYYCAQLDERRGSVADPWRQRGHPSGRRPRLLRQTERGARQRARGSLTDWQRSRGPPSGGGPLLLRPTRRAARQCGGFVAPEWASERPPTATTSPNWTGRAALGRLRSAAGASEPRPSVTAPPNWTGRAAVWRIGSAAGASERRPTATSPPTRTGRAGVWLIRRAVRASKPWPAAAAPPNSMGRAGAWRIRRAAVGVQTGRFVAHRGLYCCQVVSSGIATSRKPTAQRCGQCRPGAAPGGRRGLIATASPDSSGCCRLCAELGQRIQLPYAARLAPARGHALPHRWWRKRLDDRAPPGQRPSGRLEAGGGRVHAAAARDPGGRGAPEEARGAGAETPQARSAEEAPRPAEETAERAPERPCGFVGRRLRGWAARPRRRRPGPGNRRSRAVRR